MTNLLKGSSGKLLLITLYPLNTQTITLFTEKQYKKHSCHPVRVHALVKFDGIQTETSNYGLDKTASIVVNFHKRRLTEDQDLYVREGDFVLYDTILYEITTLMEPRLLFGQADKRFEISAKCLRSREGLFDGQ